jgi:hypothetical protein
MQHLVRASVALVLVALLAGCAGSASAPSASPTPAPVPNGPVRDAQDAAQRVLATHPEFAGIAPLNPDAIGQCCWYQVVPGAGEFRVTVHVGWGDCPSGCIENHEWTFKVLAADGTATLLGENGSPVPQGVLPPPGGARGPTGIVGVAVAGPTCPVQRKGDPNCAPRPVAAALVVVRTLDGNEVARTLTDAGGAFRVPVPPGNYTVEAKAQPAQQQAGFPIAPAPEPVTVVANSLSSVQLNFDTGIR